MWNNLLRKLWNFLISLRKRSSSQTEHCASLRSLHLPPAALATSHVHAVLETMSFKKDCPNCSHCWAVCSTRSFEPYAFWCFIDAIEKSHQIWCPTAKKSTLVIYLSITYIPWNCKWNQTELPVLRMTNEIRRITRLTKSNAIQSVFEPITT